LSFASMIPIAGWGATGAKAVVKYGDEAVAVGKGVSKASKTTKKVSATAESSSEFFL